MTDTGAPMPTSNTDKILWAVAAFSLGGSIAGWSLMAMDGPDPRRERHPSQTSSTASLVSAQPVLVNAIQEKAPSAVAHEQVKPSTAPRTKADIAHPPTLATRINALTAQVKEEKRDPAWSEESEAFIDRALVGLLPRGAVSHSSCGSRRCQLTVDALQTGELGKSPRDFAETLSTKMHEQFGSVRIYQSQPDANGAVDMHAVLAKPGYTVEGEVATSHYRQKTPR